MTKIKYILCLALINGSSALAQNPREIDLENDAVDFTNPAKFFVLIAVPIFLVVSGFLLFRYQRRRRKNKEE